jgi:geranylgeranyl diphosphate synthase type I
MSEDVPLALASIAPRVEARIDALLASEYERWAAVDPALGDPFAVLREFVAAGGKRLRPAFCHWSFVGAGGGPDDPSVVSAGAALELLHTSAIVHDDIIDGSRTRRSRDTVHVRFEKQHEANAWRDEPRRFGEGVAIIVGDLAFVYADMLMQGAPPAAAAVFDELRLEVNVGQYLDLAATARRHLSRDTSQRISRYKSGKYTVERPLHVGAALSGRLELSEELSRYGLPLGEAFQLRDDLLGTFGDAARTGKPVGDDLREGKPTLLLAIARERAGPTELRRLERLGAPDLASGEVAELQELLERTGARAEVEGLVDALVRDAIEAVGALESAGFRPEAAGALRELADYVAGRDR